MYDSYGFHDFILKFLVKWRMTCPGEERSPQRIVTIKILGPGFLHSLRE